MASILRPINTSKTIIQKIYGLIPFQLLSNCKGTIWLLEHLACSRVTDLRGKGKAHRGAISLLKGMEGCLTARHLQVVISWHELQTQPSNAKDDRSHSEIADYVPFCFLFISHKLVIHCAWILVGIYIHGSSNYSPKFNSTGQRLIIQTIHLPKLLGSEMAAN